MKYRKKPVVIEAVQWTGYNLDKIKSFVGDSLEYGLDYDEGVPYIDMVIKTLEGGHICTIGDFIIKGVKGEFYPCKPDIFAETYRKCYIPSNIFKTLLNKGKKSNKYVRNNIEDICEFLEPNETTNLDKTVICEKCGKILKGNNFYNTIELIGWGPVVIKPGYAYGISPNCKTKWDLCEDCYSEIFSQFGKNQESV